jgi:hypothetical protein
MTVMALHRRGITNRLPQAVERPNADPARLEVGSSPCKCLQSGLIPI